MRYLQGMTNTQSEHELNTTQNHAITDRTI